MFEKAKFESLCKKITQISFYVALFIELTIVILDKSAYTIHQEGLWFRLTFLLFGLSLITVKHSKREWIGLVLCAALGVISYITSGRNEILRFAVFVWACQGKDMKKVLKVTFWYTLAGSLMLVLLSVTGIYGVLSRTEIYRGDTVELRYCFGMGHPNAFHCMVFVLTLLGVYCYYDRIKWYGYLMLLVLHVVVFYFTDSRAGLLVSIGALLVIVVLRYVKVLQRCKWVYVLGIGSILFAAYLSVMMAKYNVGHPLFAKLDQYLSGRIYSLYDSANDDGSLQTWSLWSEPDNTYFFDLGFVRIFYWYGIIPAIIYIIFQCRLIWCAQKKNDYMLLAMMISITVYTIFEAHFVSEYLGRNYILFFFGMYLGELLGEKQRD